MGSTHEFGTTDYPKPEDVKDGVKFGGGRFEGSFAGNFLLVRGGPGRSLLRFVLHHDGDLENHHILTVNRTGELAGDVDFTDIAQRMEAIDDTIDIATNPRLTHLVLPEVQARWCSSLNITGNLALTGISGDLASIFVPTFDEQHNCMQFNFSNNALGVATVDAILSACAASAIVTQGAGRELDFRGGTNAVPTGGASNADYITLVENGWDVYIN